MHTFVISQFQSGSKLSQIITVLQNKNQCCFSEKSVSFCRKLLAMDNLTNQTGLA